MPEDRLLSESVVSLEFPGDRPAKSVPSVHAASRILLHLAELGRPARLTELSRSLGLTSSTCYNILKTLIGFSFVALDPATKRYTLGAGLARLTYSTATKAQIYAQIEERMHAFSQRHGVTMTLWEVLDKQHMILTLQTTGAGVILLSFRPGQRLPLYIGATGRALAAHSEVSTEDLTKRFQALRWQKALDFKTYTAQIETARVRGWAIDEGFFAAGVTSISVPVFDSNGVATRILSATFLSSGLTQKRWGSLAEELKSFARSGEELLALVD